MILMGIQHKYYCFRAVLIQLIVMIIVVYYSIHEVTCFFLQDQYFDQVFTRDSYQDQSAIGERICDDLATEKMARTVCNCTTSMTLIRHIIQTKFGASHDLVWAFMI